MVQQPSVSRMAGVGSPLRQVAHSFAVYPIWWDQRLDWTWQGSCARIPWACPPVPPGTVRWGRL